MQTDRQGVRCRIHAWIFSQDRKRATRITRWLMTSAVYLLCLLISVYANYQGMAQRGGVLLLWVYIPCGMAVLYFLLRSGLSERSRDPSLAFAQSAFAIVAILIAYATFSEIRGVILLLLPLVLVFGMLALRPVQSTRLSLLAILGLGLLMLLMSAAFPQRFPAHLEAIAFLMLGAVLLMMSWIAKRIDDLRENLRQQRSALSEALAQVHELAVRDELTTLFNRRHMVQALEILRKQFLRSGRVFCVAMLDIDYFKQINDTHGHQAGDEILRGFAAQAQDALREIDVLGRWGGEEFLLAFPETSLPKALIVLERLHERITQVALSSSVPELRISFSAGLIQHESGMEMQNLLECVDAALYQAKNQGRNRTVVWRKEKS